MELIKLKNMSQSLVHLLGQVEIQDSEELMELGAELSFLRMKFHHPFIDFQTLLLLEGAINGISIEEISMKRKEELHQFFQGIPSCQGKG